MYDSIEFALLLSALAIAAVVGARSLWKLAASRAQQISFAVVALLAVAVTVLAARELHQPPIVESEVAQRPLEIPPPEYATSDSCRACHPGEHASWTASYHSSMTQVVTPESMMGDFDNRVLKLGPLTFQLSRRDDEFWVDMPDIDADHKGLGLRVQRRIVLSTGSHHMQAYWYGTDNSRVLGLLPFVYNVESGDWLPRAASFLIPPETTVVSELGRWNKTCLECHVTQGRLRPRDHEGVGGHDTQVAEFGIACESCHGPGEAHVARYGNPLTRYTTRLTDSAAEQIVQPEELPHDRSAEVCGQCHSTSVWTSQEAIDEFMEDGFAYRPGDRLADTKEIVRGKPEWNTPAVQKVLPFQTELIPNTFWADGMNRVSGREYNGLIETGCFQRGEMSCLSCHQLHKQSSDTRTIDEWRDDQLKPGMRENLACTQCHSEYDDPATLTGHTRHLEGSSGSSCYNCHMSHTSYGLLKAIRSHQIDSPSVQVAVETGRPNACNQCHLDQPSAWTAQWLEQWYGIEPPPLSPAQRNVGEIPLIALQGDAGQRALAAWSMSWPPAVEVAGNHWQGLYLAALLADPYPAVRQIAYRSLTRMPGFADFEYDPMAPLDKLHESGNVALEQWAKAFAQQDVPASQSVLIGPEGPRVDIFKRLLDSRNDRPVAFAE